MKISTTLSIASLQIKKSIASQPLNMVTKTTNVQGLDRLQSALASHYPTLPMYKENISSMNLCHSMEKGWAFLQGTEKVRFFAIRSMYASAHFEERAFSLGSLINFGKDDMSEWISADMWTLFKKPTQPNECKQTKLFLDSLHTTLTVLDPVQRKAAMLALELFKNHMREGVFRNVMQTLPFCAAQMQYFSDRQAMENQENPAFQKSAQDLIEQSPQAAFEENFLNVYSSLFQWSQSTLDKA